MWSSELWGPGLHAAESLSNLRVGRITGGEAQAEFRVSLPARRVTAVWCYVAKGPGYSGGDTSGTLRVQVAGGEGRQVLSSPSSWFGWIPITGARASEEVAVRFSYEGNGFVSVDCNQARLGFSDVHPACPGTWEAWYTLGGPWMNATAGQGTSGKLLKPLLLLRTEDGEIRGRAMLWSGAVEARSLTLSAGQVAGYRYEGLPWRTSKVSLGLSTCNPGRVRIGDQEISLPNITDHVDTTFRAGTVNLCRYHWVTVPLRLPAGAGQVPIQVLEGSIRLTCHQLPPDYPVRGQALGPRGTPFNPLGSGNLPTNPYHWKVVFHKE